MKTKTNHSLKNHHEGFIRVPEKKNRKKKKQKSPSFTICGIEKKNTYKTFGFLAFLFNFCFLRKH